MTVATPRWSSPVTRDEMAAGDGAEIIAHIQHHGRITKDSVGGKRGDLLRLRDWQQLQIYRLFARREDGHLKHRVGLLGLPRKNTKTTVGSAIAVAVADRDTGGGEIYCCAGEKEQARIAFSTARQMIELDPELASRVKVYRDELIWPRTETRFKVLSAEAFSKEGLSPTFVLFDEVHVQPDDTLWDVMALAMGARVEPMMLGITTAGVTTDRMGNDSLAYRLYQHGCRVASGEVDDPSFYFAWWEPATPEAGPDGKTPPIDHRDPAVWEQANPGFGDLVSADDFASSVVRTHEAEFKIKRLNIWVSGKVTAIPSGYWEALEEARPSTADLLTFSVGRHGGPIEVPADWLDDVLLMLDGSWSGDSTGVVACTRDGFMFPLIHHEKTATDGPDWRVPVTAVEDDLRRALQAGARGLLLDPHRWQRTAAVLTDEGYQVHEWPTNSLARMVPAWKDFYAAVMDADGISHDGNLALARHMGNIVLKIDAHGARPTKINRMSTRHIDLGICAIGAWVNRDLDLTPAPTRARLWSAVA